MRVTLRGLALIGAMAAWAAPAAAQQTFFVAGYGGSFEQTIRKEVIPAFQVRHNVRVEYVAGNSTDTLAKLQAQRGNQQIDVAFMDDGPMFMGIQLGFCGAITGLPVDDIVPAARFPGDKAVGVGIVGTGLMYNTQVFRERGWAPCGPPRCRAAWCATSPPSPRPRPGPARHCRHSRRRAGRRSAGAPRTPSSRPRSRCPVPPGGG